MKIKRFASATELHLTNGTIVLVSYDTPVAAWTGGGIAGPTAHVAREKYSRTTSKHVTAFLERHGLRAHPVPQKDIAAILDSKDSV